MEAGFPKKCFISCSPKDEDACELLDKKLRNRGVETYSFPPIRVSPNKLNSKALIDAILDHPTLVYVQGGHSNLSFWVTFTRDYALRAHKQVQSFDPVTLKIDKCRLNPLQLPIIPWYLEKDTKKLKELFDYMRNRHIDLHSLSVHNISTGNAMPQSINELVKNTGYFLIFLTSNILKSKQTKSELENALRNHPDRMLIAIVDKINIENISGFSDRIHYVQLYGDSKRSDKQRWDDLIVNLYWLIYSPSYKFDL
jgi:hypothetical protein